MASMAGEFALPGMSVYGATKAALLFLTKSWAAEFGPRGVRVNAVTVGPTRTPVRLNWVRRSTRWPHKRLQVASRIPPRSPRPSYS